MKLKNIFLYSIITVSSISLIPVGIRICSDATPQLLNIAALSANLTFGNFTPVSVFHKDNISQKFSVKNVPVNPKYESTNKITQTENNISAQFKPEPDMLKTLPYPENINSKDGIIEKTHYGTYTEKQFFNLDNGGQVRNNTEISNSDLYYESNKKPDFSFKVTDDKPVILIYHTHTSESFEPYERDFYDASFSCRSTDPSKNVVAVGNEICSQLENADIPYVHDTLIHDYPDYNCAYDSSRKTVKEILNKYPSIKIALDIHRDAIEHNDGTRLSPVADINGTDAAQIMIISGCDNGSMGMPDYLKNFHFACMLQSKIESDWNGLTRPILFDYRHYNQDLTTGSLLIEVGSHGNSIEQVLNSGKMIGKSLAELFEK